MKFFMKKVTYTDEFGHRLNFRIRDGRQGAEDEASGILEIPIFPDDGHAAGHSQGVTLIEM